MANILLVDDAAFVRFTIRKMLETHGHTVVGDTDTGTEALRLYEELKPDLVLSDITMPEMSGIELLKRLKEIDSNVRVIMCSSMGQQAVIAEAIQLGAVDFIIKPFKEEQVIATVEKVLAKK